MVHPFLDFSLHPYFRYPVYVRTRGLVVRRFLYEFSKLVRGHLLHLFDVVSCNFAPGEEFVVEDIVFFEAVSLFVLVGYPDILVIRIHFLAACIEREEHRFYTGSGLAHQAGSAGRCDCKHRDVAPAVFYHVFVKFSVRFLDSENHRVVHFPAVVVYREGAPFSGHFDGASVGFDSKGFLYIYGKVYGFIAAVSHPEGCKHVAFGRNAESCTAASKGFPADFFPEFKLGALDVHLFRIIGNLLDNQVDFLNFQIEEIVHHAHGLSYVRLEKVEIEARFVRERVGYV